MANQLTLERADANATFEQLATFVAPDHPPPRARQGPLRSKKTSPRLRGRRRRPAPSSTGRTLPSSLTLASRAPASAGGVFPGSVVPWCAIPSSRGSSLSPRFPSRSLARSGRRSPRRSRPPTQAPQAPKPEVASIPAAPKPTLAPIDRPASVSCSLQTTDETRGKVAIRPGKHVLSRDHAGKEPVADLTSDEKAPYALLLANSGNRARIGWRAGDAEVEDAGRILAGGGVPEGDVHRGVARIRLHHTAFTEVPGRSREPNRAPCVP